MKISAMNTHYRFYDLDYFFRETSKIGFKYCEIWTSPHHFCVNYEGYDDVNCLISLENKYHMKIICICPEQTNPKPHNIAERDIEKQKRTLKYFKNIIDVSCKVKCNKVVITSGWAYYNEDKELAYKRSVAMMRKICEYAESLSVYLALEALQPDESVLVNNINDIRKYISDVNSNNLKVCIDLGAMARADETLEEYFKAFESDIIHIHFVDGKPFGHLAWGDGKRDIKKDLSSIAYYNYQGFLSLENATSRYFENPVIADCKSYKLYKENGGEE
ncbi:MAG: sugar phosphate isomerase/epimerase family protein [Anaerorhabdus sp.]